MMKLMGFAGFDTTKGKGVEDNKRGPAKGAISKHKEREYRQYMNRRGAWLWIPVQICFQSPCNIRVDGGGRPFRYEAYSVCLHSPDVDRVAACSPKILTLIHNVRCRWFQSAFGPEINRGEAVAHILFVSTRR